MSLKVAILPNDTCAIVDQVEDGNINHMKWKVQPEIVLEPFCRKTNLLL